MHTFKISISRSSKLSPILPKDLRPLVGLSGDLQPKVKSIDLTYRVNLKTYDLWMDPNPRLKHLELAGAYSIEAVKEE